MKPEKPVTLHAPLQGEPSTGLRTVTLIVLVLVLVTLAAGCSTHFSHLRAVEALAPLQLQDKLIPLDAVAQRVVTPQLLAIDDDMRQFVQRYTNDISHPRQRLEILHTALSGSATLGIRYDAQAGGTAMDVFHRGTANCLSYASLFVALAREAGLEASYQWLEVRPQWTREGERVVVRLHVNVAVKLPGKQQFMVDIDPLQSRDIASSRSLSDSEAQALYHSNFAMAALAQNDLEEAWLQAVRALQISPDMAHLWVNIGAIYRVAGQHREAQRSYLYALRLDSLERSAMNNLAVLFQMEGRQEEQLYWERRVSRYRESNPFYHAWLGEQAMLARQYQQAIRHYEKAVDLSPRDSGLLFALGSGYTQLGNIQAAMTTIETAIQFATRYKDVKAYQLYLDAIRQGRLTGS